MQRDTPQCDDPGRVKGTDEPITAGLKVKLPWLPAYYSTMLDGESVRFYYGPKKSLANALSTADFQQTDDAKK